MSEQFDLHFYLEQFIKAAQKLDQKSLVKKKIVAQTGIWLNSVVLRMQKNHWANDPSLQPQSGPAIFFSIWLNAKSAKKGIIQYNIHALKLRQLKGYSLTSRAFANAFRKKFKPFEKDWPHVNTHLGPLTLMEGWKKVNLPACKKDIFEIATQFLKIEHLIEDLLELKKIVYM